MSSLPPPEEIAGPYLQQYEVYYKRLDPEGKGEIGAMDAAGFLKKSKLPDETLGKIWDIADYQSKGVLDRAGFFVACKMVALVQCDQPLTVDNARVESKAPNFGPVETAPGAPTASLPGTEDGPVHVKNALNFLVKPEEKRKYDALFDQLQPQDGKIGGDKVRNVMMGSKLPTGVLGKIWDLSDVDRDGMLDRYEFTVAMHLVYRALQGDKIPDQLPDELLPEKVPKPLSALPNLNGTAKPPVQAAAAPQRVEVVPWVVNSGEKLRFNNLFKQTDTDGDGFVSGVEIKNVFLQTGLPQNILAHIWNLCDMKQEGKLNPEQFCLAMWLINRKQSGRDPPAALTPDMVPPSMRPKGQDAGTANSVYNNPELEMIAKDIQSLLSEKIQLEKESQDAEYNLSVKNTEFHSLQSEFDTLSSTLKQLTNQKNVAQKRLDDLDSQKSSLEEDFQKLLDRIEEENQKIEKLRSQADEQEATLVAQEEEVQGKQKELEKLKQEEQTLLEDIKKSEKEIELLERDLGVANELTSEVTEQLENLTEAEGHMTKANAQFQTLEAAGEDGDYSCIPDPFLEPLRLNLEEPDFTRLERKPEKPPVPEPPVQMNGSMSDSDHFGGTSPAPPSQQRDWTAANAFSSSGFDAFGGQADQRDTEVEGNSLFAKCKTVGDGQRNPQDGDNPPPLVPRPDSSDSPTPALPPKSSTAPPRRPPPPKRPPPPGGASKAAPPVPPPPQANSDDPFGAKADDVSGGGFADFANFDSQLNFGSTNLSRQGGGFNAQWDSAFGVSDGDSALGSSTDPTPTHKAKSTLEFDGDPFKDSEHRYGDPFGLEGADPVEDSFDPFAAEVNEDTIEDVFGTWRTKKQKERPKAEDLWANSFDARPVTPTAPPRPVDPFVAKANDPFQSSGGSDPFATISSSFKVSQAVNLDDSFDPFSMKNQKRQEAAAVAASSATMSSGFGNDPFQPSPQPPAKPPPPKSDPFGAPADRLASVATAPSAVDFDSVFGKPFTPPPAKNNNNKPSFTSGGFDDSFTLKTSNKLAPNKLLQKSETVSSVPNAAKSKKSASSLSRPWTDSGASSAGESSSKRGGLKLLGIGSGKDSGDKGDKGEKKKKTSSFGFRKKTANVDKSQSAVDLSYLSSASVLATSVEDTQIKMASEASKRAEEDRMRRLRLQEERELAYAIALSKAEAASLKNK